MKNLMNVYKSLLSYNRLILTDMCAHQLNFLMQGLNSHAFGVLSRYNFKRASDHRTVVRS